MSIVELLNLTFEHKLAATGSQMSDSLHAFLQREQTIAALVK
jgi:hypothetical protein